MIKNLLLPTDFSDNSMHAIRYALELNKRMKSKVILFHSYVIPVYATDIPLVVPADKELESDTEKALAKLRNDLLTEFPGQSIETWIQSGYAEEEITEAAVEKNADLIIMGTQGASGLREVLVGSITASVIDHAPCPVMAVPEHADLKKLEKIVFATNYADDDFENVERVIAFAKYFDADVILLHISSGEYDKTYEFEAIERFKDRVSEDTKYKKVSFKLLENKNIYEGLSLYLEEIKSDMCAMSMRKRSFIQKLFNRSMTRKMAYHSHIPLIAFKTEI